MAENDIAFPSIVFRVKDGLYAIDSRNVATIMQLPAYQKLMNPPPCVTGLFLHRGVAVQMLDLRLRFGMRTLEQEYDEFCGMIDARKQDHVHWVEELERSIKAKEPFTLSADPHQCAFGKWYDGFHSTNNAVLFHMKKIEQPHRELHHAALEVAICGQHCETCEREKCLKTVLSQIRNKDMPLILSLLEEVKTIFKMDVYREMALILNDTRGVALVVDEVLAVEDLEDAQEPVRFLEALSYLSSVKKSTKFAEMILALDVSKLLDDTAAKGCQSGSRLMPSVL